MDRDGVKVLIVEDNEGDFILLEQVFAEIDWASFDIDWTPRWDDALEKMAAGGHDVYLIDYQLGLHTGVELLVEAHKLGCTAPIIVLTGRGHYEADVEAMKAGAADYLVKGQINPRLLERSIRYALARNRILEALKRSQKVANQHQEELAHVARLNTMVEMATGLAHELNQPLAAIVNYVKGCRRRLEIMDNEPCSELLEALDRAGAEARRAGQILQRIRAMVKKRPPDRVRVCLNDLASDAADLLRSELRFRRVELTLELDPDLPPSWVDCVQIEQVILNLMKNAIEAMEPVPEPERRLKVTTRRDGDAAELSVQDSGPGIEPDARDRIFDAFYTTKSEGMGMGLSICRSILESQGGRLWVTGNPDGGAIFHFSLPLENDRELLHA